MQIEIVNVNISTMPTAKGSYQAADVAYKNKSFQDKLEGKKVMDFASKVVFDTLSKAKFGDVYTITRVKNDKGFWDWIAANADSADSMGNSSVPAGPSSTSSAAPRSVATPAPKSNYETSEERAARQVMIVRQSTLSTAVSVLSAAADKKTPITPDTVIAVAKQFEDHVFGRAGVVAVDPTPTQDFFDDMADDLPV